MKNALLYTVLLSALATTCNAASTARTPDASQQIRQVMEQFQEAVIDKDKATLSALFLPDHTSWVAVLSAPSYRAMHTAHPQAPRFKPGSPAQFIDAVAGYAGSMRETFSNVRIHTDGTVASAYFDYVFLRDGKPTNHGSETWQLIRTVHGWKINALIYSVTFDTKLP